MKLILSSQQHKDRACEFIQELQLDRPWLLVISEKKKNRSAAQNSLYWKWVTQLAGEEGSTKEEVHHERKRRFLAIIYERDSPKYAEMIGTVRKMWGAGFKQDSESLHNGIIELTSTTTATVKQFREYLEDIEKLAIQQDIFLERPEDMYREAMNK